MLTSAFIFHKCFCFPSFPVPFFGDNWHRKETLACQNLTSSHLPSFVLFRLMKHVNVRHVVHIWSLTPVNSRLTVLHSKLIFITIYEIAFFFLDSFYLLILNHPFIIFAVIVGTFYVIFIVDLLFVYYLLTFACILSLLLLACVLARKYIREEFSTIRY